ncbi:MAG: hypothetical protein ACTHJU_08540 [Sphingopyxis sp.]
MLHLLLDDRPWFRPKNRGYGAGLPIAWQGWLMLAMHMALIAGVAALCRGHPALAAALVVFAGIAPMPLYRAKTESGWRRR